MGPVDRAQGPGPGPRTSGQGPQGPGPVDRAQGPVPGPGTSGFSQLLALAAKVASLLSQEEHYALRVAKADTTYSRVKEEVSVCGNEGCFALCTIPLADSFETRKKNASSHSAFLYSRALVVTRGRVVSQSPRSGSRKVNSVQRASCFAVAVVWLAAQLIG